MSTVDVPLAVIKHVRGHELLNPHEILARRCGFGYGEVELLMSCKSASLGTYSNEKSMERTYIMFPPNQPLIIPHRPCIRNLEPIAVALVLLQITVRRTGEVDLRGALVPIDAVFAVAIPRDSESYFGAGQDVGCFGGWCRGECRSAAGDVGGVDVHLGRDFGVVASFGVVPWSGWVFGDYVAARVRLVRVLLD